MRFVVARRSGRRGAGLGNEMIMWAKGFIASQVLGATQVGPSWGINERKYYRNFGTSRLDFLLEDLLIRLPHYIFTDEDFDRSEEKDFGRAIEAWARLNGLLEKRFFIVVVEGMYWGYPAVRNARCFLKAKLLNSRDALTNFYQVAATLDAEKIFVAVHMRFGDFTPLPPGAETRGRANFRIPPAWYLRVCETLQGAMGDRVRFHFFTDFGGPEFDEAVRRFNPGQELQSGFTECSDILLMAEADLRICSVSSYSLVSSFFNDGMYVWYEPQSILEDGFYQSSKINSGRHLRDVQTSQSRQVMASASNEDIQEMVLGWPIGVDGALPEALITRLERKVLHKKAAGNLMAWGAVPERIVQDNVKA
jgi:hypothetical protein